MGSVGGNPGSSLTVHPIAGGLSGDGCRRGGLLRLCERQGAKSYPTSHANGGSALVYGLALMLGDGGEPSRRRLLQPMGRDPDLLLVQVIGLAS